MDKFRIFGLLMIVLGLGLLAFEVTGTLLPAPLLLVFGTLASVGVIALGVRALMGKF